MSNSKGGKLFVLFSYKTSALLLQTMAPSQNIFWMVSLISTVYCHMYKNIFRSWYSSRNVNGATRTFANCLDFFSFFSFLLIYCVSKEHLLCGTKKPWWRLVFGEEREHWLANISVSAGWNADQAAYLPFFNVTENKTFYAVKFLRISWLDLNTVVRSWEQL